MTEDKNIELQNTSNRKLNESEEDDDILIENSKDKTRERVQNKKERIESIGELKKLIYSYEPVEIKDWPKRPYKTIIIVSLLLCAGLLFTYVGFSSYLNDSSYDVYLPYSCLGILLLFPGFYYSYMLINILLGTEGYEYSDLPDLSD